MNTLVKPLQPNKLKGFACSCRELKLLVGRMLPVNGSSRAPRGLGQTLRVFILVGMSLVLAQMACADADFIVGDLVNIETVQGPGVQVYFTAPDDSAGMVPRQRSLPSGFLLAVDQAESTIDIAAYDLDLERIAEQLIAAEQRGVRVRLVTESDHVADNRDLLIELQQAGIPVIQDERESGLMHNKFAVIDGEQVWSGSWNMTHSGSYRNDNNAVRITSPGLAENYTAEFEEMVAGRFGPDSPATTPNPRLSIAVKSGEQQRRRIEIENYFAPEDGVEDEIIAEIESAQKRIRFLAFVFTSDEIAAAMLRRAEAGVVVQGVMESRNVNGQYDEYRRLRSSVHDVLTDGNPYMMHHKVIILDDETVILGSYNFSRSADTTNDENLLIIHDPILAGAFVEEFGRVYENARRAE